MSTATNIVIIYDMVKDRIKDSTAPVAREDLQRIVTLLEKMDNIGKEVFLSIIKIYALRNTDVKILDVPFGGDKKSDEEIIFNVNDFPGELQKMLLLFLEMHMGKLEDDKLRVN